MIQNILNNEVLPIPKSYSENLKDLIDLLLKKDADLRPSITELVELKIVKDKFEEFKLNEESELDLQTISNNKILSKVSSVDKFESMNRQDKFENKNKLEIEVEIDFNSNNNMNRKNKEKKIQKQVNDTSNINSQNKSLPLVIKLTCGRDLF